MTSVYAFDRQTVLREIAHYEGVVARITARGVTTMAQRDALAGAQKRLTEERNALVTLAGLENV